MASRSADTPKGFTLIEVIMVMVIILIVASLAYPGIEAMQNQFAVDTSVDQVKGRFAECRAHAIEEGVSYRFAVHPESSEFKIAPDTTDYWDDSTGIVGVVDPTAHPLTVQESVEDGVVFHVADATTPTSGTGPNTVTAPVSSGSGGWTTVVVFQPDGTCANDAEIRFALGGGRPTVLKVRALTGIIQTQRDNTP